MKRNLKFVSVVFLFLVFAIVSACENDILPSSIINSSISTSVVADTVTITNANLSIKNGEKIIATTTKQNSSVKFRLKTSVEGISIDETSGVVTIASSVAHNTSFVVVAFVNESIKVEKTFSVNNLLPASLGYSIGLFSLSTPEDVTFNITLKGETLTQVKLNDEVIGASNYTYVNNILTLKASYLATLTTGEKVVKFITSENSYNLLVKVADKFISTANEFSQINDSVDNLNKYYILINDIDLAQFVALDPEGWLSIGQFANESDVKSFKGVFDGNGHVIKNIFINRVNDWSSDEYNVGLFGYLTSTAVVKNLGLIGGSIYAKSFVGAIAGNNQGLIENCFVDVKVQAQGANAGGIVGANYGVIKNSYVIGNVVAESGTPYAVSSRGAGRVENTFALNTVAFDFNIADASLNTVNSGFKTNEEMKQASTFASYDHDLWYIVDGYYPILKISREMKLPTKLDIVNKSFNVGVGQTQVLLSYEPENAYNLPQFSIKELTSGVTVSKNGLITVAKTAVDGQKFIVVAQIGTVSVEKEFTVHIEVTDITISNPLNIAYNELGTEFDLNTTIKPSNANNQLIYSIKHPVDGITVSTSGKVTIANSVSDKQKFIIVVEALSGVKVEKEFIYGYLDATSVTIENNINISTGIFNLKSTVLPIGSSQVVTYRLKEVVQGVTMENGVVTVAHNVLHNTTFTVIAKTQNDIEVEKTFTVTVNPTSLDLILSLSEVYNENNRTYLPIFVSIYPTNANQAHQFTLVDSILGVSIVDGVLVVENTVANGTLIKIRGTAGDLTKDVSIIYSNQSFDLVELQNNKVVFGKDNYLLAQESEEKYDATFTLSKEVVVNSIKLNDLLVSNDEYSVVGNVITLKGSYLLTLPANEYTVSIETEMVSLFGLLKVGDRVILTVEDLRAIDRNVETRSKYYILGAHLNLTSYQDADGGGFMLLCKFDEANPSTLFNGVFDGNGYSISNLILKRRTSTYADTIRYNVGLFGGTTANAVIKNLALLNVNIDGRGYVGTLVGTNNGLIENVYVTGKVISQTTVAGLVGTNGSTGVVRNVYVLASVSSDNSNTQAFGLAYNNYGKFENAFSLFQKDGRLLFTAKTGSVETNVRILQDAELKAVATYSSFDKSIWNIVEGSYPTFK